MDRRTIAPRRVGTLAVLALALTLAGGGLALASQSFGPRLLVASVLAVAGAGLAAFCIRDGVRNGHERGRYASWLAIFPGLILVLWPLWVATTRP